MYAVHRWSEAQPSGTTFSLVERCVFIPTLLFFGLYYFLLPRRQGRPARQLVVAAAAACVRVSLRLVISGIWRCQPTNDRRAGPFSREQWTNPRVPVRRAQVPAAYGYAREINLKIRMPETVGGWARTTFLEFGIESRKANEGRPEVLKVMYDRKLVNAASGTS